MKRGRLTTEILAAMLLVSLGVAGCTGQPGNSRPDSVVIALPSEPFRLNPLFLSDFTSYTVSGWIFNGLTRIGDDLRVTGDLAESWEVLQGGREIRFRLRKGVRWHDGVELTAEDVVFTYEQAISPKHPGPHSGRFGPVRSVRAVDRYTVSVTYHEPYGPAFASWTIGILPEHALRGKDLTVGDSDRGPVGTGPFRLVSWVPGEKLVFEAFRDQFRGPPGVKRVVVRILPDAASRLMELKAGGIDLMEVPASHLNRNVRGASSNGLNYIRCPSFRNHRDGRFQDRRVRQAISMALEREAIVQAVLFGAGRPSMGPWPSGSPYASPRVKPFAYDPNGAAALLREAGWVRGEDGVLRKDRRPFAFTILTNGESEEHSKTAQLIQAQLKTLGIEVTIRQLDWQTFRHQAVAKHDFEAVVLSRAYMYDADPFDLWHSSRNREGEWNYLSYANPQVDRLLESGRRTIDEHKRQAIYRKVHEIMADDFPCIFLYDADGLYAARPRIKGAKSTPLGILNDISRLTVSSGGE
jgi:peptide/nickel transport system substrate-binding protein